ADETGPRLASTNRRTAWPPRPGTDRSAARRQRYEKGRAGWPSQDTPPSGHIDADGAWSARDNSRCTRRLPRRQAARCRRSRSFLRCHFRQADRSYASEASCGRKGLGRAVIDWLVGAEEYLNPRGSQRKRLGAIPARSLQHFSAVILGL